MATQSLPRPGGPPNTYSLREVIPLVRESTTLPGDINLQADKICDSTTCARAFRQLKDWDREVFSILLLNGKNRVTAFSVISIGTLTASLVHPREVFSLPCSWVQPG